MKWVRRLVGFAVAVVATSVLGAIAHSQLIAAEVSRLGHPVPFGDRLSWAAHDAFGMFSTYAPIIVIGFLIAFLVAALITRRLPHLRSIGYTLAGATAIVVAIFVMKQLLDVNGIASARTVLGVIAQGIAGAIGGWAFAIVSRDVPQRGQTPPRNA
jgi:hypothetical protein